MGQDIVTGLEAEGKFLKKNWSNPWVITGIVLIVLITAALIWDCTRKNKVDADDEFKPLKGEVAKEKEKPKVKDLEKEKPKPKAEIKEIKEIKPAKKKS